MLFGIYGTVIPSELYDGLFTMTTIESDPSDNPEYELPGISDIPNTPWSLTDTAVFIKQSNADVDNIIIFWVQTLTDGNKSRTKHYNPLTHSVK